MSRKGRNHRQKPRRPREPRERPETPQTRAKLQDDPLQLLLAGRDVSLEHAADEIREVYTAVCRSLFSKGQAFGPRIPGKGELTDEIAWKHATTYIPWTLTRARSTVSACLDMIVDRHGQPARKQWILDALADYAKRMRERGRMEDAA